MRAKVILAGLMSVLLGGGAALAVEIETVPVGDPGNAADTETMNDGTTGYGSVAYEYNIGKYEVSNAEYVAFLNAVDPDGSNTHDLYHTGMSIGYGGITFTPGAVPGSKYAAISGRGNMPVCWVSFWDACRFANWLHNGQGTGDTEDGAYTLTPGGIAGNTVSRNADWEWAVCSEDEWYKAAFHDGDAGAYYDYATGSDTAPTYELPPGTDMTAGSANFGKAVGDFTDCGAYDAKPSDSPYGTFDQAGNVWEWNEAIMLGGSKRGCRGGADTSNEDELPASWRSYLAPDGEGEGLGFRVVQVPEPATLAALAFGSMALLRRRRKRR